MNTPITGKEYDMQAFKKALSASFSFLHRETKVQEQDQNPVAPRPMTGFLATMTDDQKKQALDYCGDDTDGDKTFAR